MSAARRAGAPVMGARASDVRVGIGDDGRGDIPAVAPLRNVRLAALRGACALVAAWVALPCVRAHAQLASPSYTDPLTAKLQTSPSNPPRFQKLDREGLA